MQKLKKLLLISIFILISSAFLFWGTILSSFVEYSFKSYCKNCLSTILKAEKISYDDHLVVFENLNLVGKESAENIHLDAERVLLYYEPHFFKREIDVYVTLIDPKFDLSMVATSVRFLLENNPKELGFLKINYQIEIKNGVVSSSTDHDLEEIYFCCNYDFIRENELTFQASVGSLTCDENCMELILWKDSPEVTVVDVNFKKLCCNTMHKTFSLIFPDEQLKISDGFLNGNATIVFKQDEKPEIISNLVVENLSFEYPPFNMYGNIPKSHLSFSETEKNKGRLDLKHASVLICNDGSDILKFYELAGSCFFEGDHRFKISLEGKANHELENFDSKISVEKNLDSYLLDINLDSIDKKNISFNLTSKGNLAEIKVNNIGPREFYLSQLFLKDLPGNFREIQLTEGILDAEFKLKISNSKIEKFKLSKISAQQLKVNFCPLNFKFQADRFFGTFDTDLLSEQFLEHVNANILIAKGSLEFIDHTAPIVTDINTDLTIENGLITKSSARLKFLDLDGNIDFNFLDDDQLIRFNFTGNVKQLISKFPEKCKKQLEKSFKEDKLSFGGQLKKIIDTYSFKEMYLLEGGLDVISDISGEQETLLIGFELGCFDQVNNQALTKKMVKFNKLKIKNGWFNAEHLNLEKYLSPFIFQDTDIKITGFGDFKGTFEDSKVDVIYNGHNVALENEHYVMETQSIQNAKHRFDLKTHKGSGVIPITQGSYFEKNSGLLFTDIQAVFDVDEKQIKSSSIEAFCNGAYFQGTQDLDLSSPNKGEFTLNFNIPMMKGKFSQVQHIFSHFNKPYFFLKMPLESDVSLRQEGAILNFDFKPDESQVKAIIKGDISNGTLQSDNFDVAIQELNVNFDYNHEANDLSFSDIQGTLLVGKPERMEEYLFAGDHIRFTDYCNNESTFDVWVGDKNRDIMRIVGNSANAKAAIEGEELIEITLNHELSHFGDMHPKFLKFVLKDWSEVDTLKLELGFKLGAIFNDLQRFGRTGFFFLSRGLLKELNELKNAKGDFLVELDYDKTRSVFNYNLTGKDVGFGTYQFDTAFLKGSKFNHIWSIQELKLDKLSIAADILYHENICKVNFLSVQMGSSLLIGLEGEYKREENKLLTRVNFFEANFDNLKEWAILKNTYDEFAPKGNLKGTGELKVEFGKGPNRIQADLLLNASLTKFQSKGLEFRDMEGLSCHYVTEKGIVLRGIKGVLANPIQDETKSATKNEMALLDIDKIEYDFRDHAFTLEGLNFKIAKENLEPLTHLIEKAFKNTFSEAILDTIKYSKKNGFLEGSLSMDISSPYYALRLALKDGNYTFLSNDHNLQNFTIEFDPCEFKLSTDYTFKNLQFGLKVSSKSPNLEFGKLVFADIIPENVESIEDQTPLVIYWRNHTETGVTVETAEGEFSGMKASLYRNPEEPLEAKKFHLIGDIELDINRLTDLTTLEFSEKIKSLQIGAGYTFKGNWSLFDGKSFDLFNSEFKGQLIGNNFEFKGFQFQTLIADVDYRKNNIFIEKLHLDDPSGTLQTEKLRLTCQGDEEPWKISFPLCQIHDFRPSLISQIGTNLPFTKKPLVITQLDLENIEGNLLDETTFKGYGRFSFKNPHKKNLQNTIFAIPAEIISRIGLDLTVLTPVVGTIEYQLLDGKMLLTKFKDVFSEGKLSRFYLATTPYPSYVDFDGNLFMKVRMKQYNLLFKLAELFIVSVEGNLKKPTYTLQKQPKHDHDHIPEYMPEHENDIEIVSLESA